MNNTLQHQSVITPTDHVASQKETEWRILKAQAEVVAKSKLCPQGFTPADVLGVALLGRELGIGVMASLQTINPIKGRFTMSALGMRGLVFRRYPHAKFWIKENTTEACVIEAARSTTDPISVFSFTMEDARRAGLLSNPSWQKYPREMLVARATSIACRTIFPDVLMGCAYTPDEVGGEASDQDYINNESVAVQKSAQISNTATTTAGTGVNKPIVPIQGGEHQRVEPVVSGTEVRGPVSAVKSKTISEKQAKMLFAVSRDCGWTHDELKEYLIAAYDIDSTKLILRDQFEELLNILKTQNINSAMAALDLKNGPPESTINPLTGSNDDIFNSFNTTGV
jgi:hypothetical protein